MDKLDFKTFDERFENTPVTVGSEQSEIDNKRDAFIAENALTYKPTPVVPANVPGKFSPKSLNFFKEISTATKF
jgi:hypothetical protein